MNLITTLRQADKLARQLGLKRGPGTYNGAAYWKNDLGVIITRDFLETLAIHEGLI